MSGARVNQFSVAVSLLCAALAFALVLGNIIAGVPPQPDENASAHLWQLLMAVQLLFVGIFVLTADWHRRRHVLTLAGVQLAAFCSAALPVYLAGY